MIHPRRIASPVVLAALALVATACGSDTKSTSDAEPAASAVAEDRPTVVVTTNILGDVVGQFAGGQADVITIMPVGADPHDFQASAQEIDQLNSSDALIVNGAGFEEGLLDVIESAQGDGVPTFEAISAVSTIEFGEGEHGHDDEHADDDKEHSDDGEHADGEEHSDDGDEDHDHDGVDPHFFTDPERMADAVDGIVEFLLSEVDGLDAAALESSAAEYVGELESVDAEVVALVDGLAPESRVLVTNHEVFGYFAERYDFEVVGTVVPGGATTDAASAGELAELADTLNDEGVTAIFADTSSSDDLVEALAGEVGDVEIVELFSESLGAPNSGGSTYLDMIRVNAERITAALA